nr:hypothetical protein [uncultured Methanospirillum sp.]
MNTIHECLNLHRSKALFLFLIFIILQGVVADSISSSSNSGGIFHYNNPITQSSTTNTPIFTTTDIHTTTITTLPTIGNPKIDTFSNPGASSPNMNIILNPGWNFITTPSPLVSGKNTFNIFRDINTGGHSLYGFDPQSGWRRLNSSDYFEPIRGIWIYSIRQTSVPLEFENGNFQKPEGINLKKGWNAIGTSSTTKISITDFLSTVNDKWVFFVPFNSTTQIAESPLIRGWKPDILAEEFSIQPGIAYWLFMSSDADLTNHKKISDIAVSGTVAYNTESDGGWKFTIPGTVKGSISPDTGVVTIESSDAYLTYAGKKYPIKMNINALMNQKS